MVFITNSKKITEAVNKIQLSDHIIKDKNFDVLWISATDKFNSDTLTTHFHQHTFFEIHIITYGYVEYGFDNFNVKVSTGNMIIIPTAVRHTVRGFSDTFSKLTIAFEPYKNTDFNDVLDDIANKLFAIDESLYESLKNIFEHCISKSPYKSELTMLSVMHLIYQICSQYGDSTKISKQACDDSDSRVNKAKKYINDNMDIYLTCEDVANHCHISSKQLGRIFKEKEGMSLLEYIHSRKLSSALIYLDMQDMTLQEISDRLGFSTVQYFCKFIKAQTGKTPSEFRIKQHI